MMQCDEAAFFKWVGSTTNQFSLIRPAIQTLTSEEGTFEENSLQQDFWRYSKNP